MHEHTAPMSKVAILTTTVVSIEDARRLARESITRKLAACAQVEQIESHYVWQDQVCEEAEWRVVFKTLPQALPALQDWARGAHPYDVPQLLVREEQASREYAEWVAGQL